MSNKSELKGMTYDELADMASKEKIRGRSKMGKEDLVEALAKPKPAAKKSTGRTKSSSSKNEEIEELLKDVLKHLDRPMFNGHHHGCPASVNPDKICACKARRGRELAERIEKSLK